MKGGTAELVVPHWAFVLGGASSGKSAFGARLAASYGRPVLFVATAAAGDPEMAARIEAHRRSRPPTWTTLEAPTDVADALRPHLSRQPTVLLDCLSLLVANCLFEGEVDAGSASRKPAASDARPRARGARSTGTGHDEDLLDAVQAARTLARVDAEVRDLLGALREARCHLVVVSSEVGLGVVPTASLGRLYRDALGRANQQVAAAADHVYMLLAGIPFELNRVDIPGVE